MRIVRLGRLCFHILIEDFSPDEVKVTFSLREDEGAQRKKKVCSLSSSSLDVEFFSTQRLKLTVFFLLFVHTERRRSLCLLCRQVGESRLGNVTWESVVYSVQPSVCRDCCADRVTLAHVLTSFAEWMVEAIVACWDCELTICFVFSFFRMKQMRNKS